MEVFCDDPTIRATSICAWCTTGSPMACAHSPTPIAKARGIGTPCACPTPGVVVAHRSASTKARGVAAACGCPHGKGHRRLPLSLRQGSWCDRSLCVACPYLHSSLLVQACYPACLLAWAYLCSGCRNRCLHVAYCCLCFVCRRLHNSCMI